MTKVVYHFLWLLAGGWFAATVVSLLPDPVNLPVVLLLAAVFTLPGWALARWVAGSDADWLTRAVLALPIGYMVGAAGAALLRLAGAGSPWAVVTLCLVLAALLTRVLRPPCSGLLDLARLDSRDRIALAVLWLAAIAITGPVFARVGEVAPLGLAYRAYFNADLFVHMAVVAEVAKGTTPPMNPFFPTEALPYYWTYFTLPAVFSQFRPALPVDPGIMLTDLTMAVVFISVGFLTVRNLGASARAAAISWLVVLFASSFEGAFLLWDQLTNNKPLSEFRFWNIDAVTRWVWNLPGVDGFHRAMWWTPQHLMALSLGLIVLLGIVRSRRENTVHVGVFEGFLLGGIMIVSSFNGVILVGWYGLTQVVLLALSRGRDFRMWFTARAIAAVIVVGFLGLATSLGMVQRIPDAFLFGWNRFFLRGPWAFLLLSFGPALFFAPFGIGAAVRASHRLVIALGALLLVSAVIFLQLDLRGHENTQVTFRTGQLLYISLAILLAFAIDAWRRRGRIVSAVGLTVLGLGATAAVPTVAMDWYNARDISNIDNSPGNFPWTLHISRDDQAAAAWIHAVLPMNATVQTDALPRDRNTWAFITAFARRRMATGNGLFTLNPTRYLPNLTEIHEAFGSATPEAAHASLARLGADYVYVGDVERQVNGDQVNKFALNPDLFEAVYWRGSVEIYRVIR